MKKVFVLLSVFTLFLFANKVFAATASGCIGTDTNVYKPGDVMCDGTTGNYTNCRECKVNANGSFFWDTGTTAKQPVGTGTSQQDWTAMTSSPCSTFSCSLGGFAKQVADAEQTGNTSQRPWVASAVDAGINTLSWLSLYDGGKIDANGNPKAGGAMALFSNMMGAMYDAPPASTYAYVNYVARNAGFEAPVKPVYAASGIGFSALDPVMKIWQVMRNIAYLALSIVFVVVGLMIILRVKIDPKTVITIQNALPKMILSMILITFSYPIAGFMIDLMYVLIGLVMSLAQSGGLIADTTFSDFKNGLQSQTIFGFVGINTWWAASTGAGASIQKAVEQIAAFLTIGNINIAGIGANALGTLIIAIAILYALFKTWLSLLGAYVNILIGTIFSPFAMLGEAIPGMSSFGTWLRSMVAALLPFPTVVLLMVFGKSIMEYGSKFASAGTSTGAFVPPLIGGNDASAVTSLIGLGILLMTPKVVEMVSEFVKAPPFKYGMAWQESIGAAQRVGQAGWGASTQDFVSTKAEWQKQRGAALANGTALPSRPASIRGRIGTWWPF